MDSLITSIGTGLTTVLGWVGQVINGFTGADGALAPLLPLIGISVAISALLLGFKLLKGTIWGA